MLAPVRLNDDALALAVITGAPVHVVVAAGLAATVKVAPVVGKGLLTDKLVKGMEPLLVIVTVSRDVPPKPTDVGLNAADALMELVSVALTELDKAPPSVEDILAAGIVLVQGPPAVVNTSTEKVQLPLLFMVIPDKLTDVAPGLTE